VNPLSFSIVIPCRNEEKYIIRCLQSVFQNNYHAEKLEVIVCDGMSNDNTRSLLEEYRRQQPQLQYLDNPKKTTQFALNLGIQKSRMEVVMILGAHAELAPGYFEVCNRILQAMPEVMCVGGVLENIYEDPRSAVIAQAMSSPFGVGSAHFRTGARSGAVDTVAFGCYRRAVFEQVGLFDEQLVRNQDDEFNYRLQKNNLMIWLTTETSVKYFVRASFSKLFRQYYQYGYWKVFVNRKHHAVTSMRQLVPLGFVLFVLLGWLPALLTPLWLLVYAGIWLLYLSAAALFAVQKSSSIRNGLLTIYSFLLLHGSYGWGYLRGIVDFLLLQKNPSAHAKQLTR